MLHSFPIVRSFPCSRLQLSLFGICLFAFKNQMVKLEAGERSELRMLLQFGTQKLIEAWTRKVYCRAILQHPPTNATNATTAQSLRDVVTNLANQLGCLWFRLDNDGMEVENPLLNPLLNPNGKLRYNPTSSSFNLLDHAIHNGNLPLSRELLVSRDYSSDEIATIILHKPRSLPRLQFKGRNWINTLEFLKSWLSYRHQNSLTNQLYSSDVLLALNAPPALKLKDFEEFTKCLKHQNESIPIVDGWREVVARRLSKSNNLFEVVSMDVRMRKNVSTNQLLPFVWLNWKNKSGMKELLISIYFAAASPKDFTKQITAFNKTVSGSWISLSEETVTHCTHILTNLTAAVPSPDFIPLVTHYI